MARPATAARALSDFERFPFRTTTGLSPRRLKGAGSPMSRGSRRFPSPGQSLQARRGFPPAATLGLAASFKKFECTGVLPT